MQYLYTITGQSQLKPNYFAISSDNKTLVSNAHSLMSGEEQYENVNFWELSTDYQSRISSGSHRDIPLVIHLF